MTTTQNSTAYWTSTAFAVAAKTTPATAQVQSKKKPRWKWSGEEDALERVVVAEHPRHRKEVACLDHHRHMAVEARGRLDRHARQRVLELGEERRGVHHASFCCAIFRWSCTIP